MKSCNAAIDVLLNRTNITVAAVTSILEELEQVELKCKIPAFIFLALVLIVGIPGNALVYFVYKFKFPPGPTKSFILALALFDLQVCLLGVPFEIVDLKTDYFLNIPALCKIVRFSNTFASTGSVLILLVIAVYRYKKICLPFKKQITMREVRHAFIGVGISTVSLSWPALMFYGNHTHDIHGLQTSDCSFDDLFMDTLYPQFYQVFIGILCFVMMGILTVIYTLVVVQIIKQKRRGRALGSLSGTLGSRLDIADDSNSKGAYCMKKTPSSLTASTSSLNGDKIFSTVERKQTKHVKRSQTTIMMLLVTIAFIVSYIPHVTLQITRRLDSGFESRIHCNQSALAAYRLFLRSFFLNSAINPIIYGFYNKTFRKECKRLLAKVLQYNKGTWQT